MARQENGDKFEPEATIHASADESAAGPRTKLGKMRASRNAVRHGIFADILLAGDEMGEAREEYLRLLSALRESIRARDYFVDLQIESLAFLYLRLTRIYKADLRIAPKLFKKVEEVLDADDSSLGLDILNLGTQTAANRKDPAPELIIRYESNCVRQISRAMDLLVQWRTIHPNGPKPPTAVPSPGESRTGKGPVDYQPLIPETEAQDGDSSTAAPLS